MADNINVGGLQRTWDSFGNPVVIDSKGNIVDVVYGGANNDIVSMTTRGSVGGDPVTNYYDANGNFTHATSNNPTVEGGKNFVVDYDASGKAYKREYNPDEWGDVKRIVSTIGAAALGGAGAGSWLGGTLGLGTGALGSAAGGALIGGGLAGATGQDVGKGVLLGGLGGYLQGSGGIDDLLGNTSNDFFPIGGPSGTTLTPAAIESGLGTAGYGFNAGAAASGLFDPSLIGSGAGGSFDPTYTTPSGDYYSNEGRNYPTPESTQGTGGSPVNASLSTPGGLPLVTVNTPTTTTLTTPPPAVTPTDLKKVTDIAKVVTTVGGLLGGGAVAGALTNAGSGGSNVSPTQGVPVANQDYYNAIQQYYNAYMPNKPQDVKTPLQNWYSGMYGNGLPQSATTVLNEPMIPVRVSQ